MTGATAGAAVDGVTRRGWPGVSGCLRRAPAVPFFVRRGALWFFRHNCPIRRAARCPREHLSRPARHGCLTRQRYDLAVLAARPRTRVSARSSKGRSSQLDVAAIRIFDWIADGPTPGWRIYRRPGGRRRTSGARSRSVGPATSTCRRPKGGYDDGGRPYSGVTFHRTVLAAAGRQASRRDLLLVPR